MQNRNWNEIALIFNSVKSNDLFFPTLLGLFGHKSKGIKVSVEVLLI